jgi:catechol 2,3-dioxygenase-like lactoylglutathione lyase family enzyme
MSPIEPPVRSPAVFGGVNPIFRVRDLSASTEYYVSVLGFKIDFHGPGTITAVSRGRCGLFLVQGDQGNFGAWVWIGVSDVGALFDEYQSQGAKIRHPPTNYSWAYEMQVEDPDGNVLRIGSDPKEDEPFGEWLDMHGRKWVRLSDGGWKPLES